jgi:hypothetical protein
MLGKAGEHVAGMTNIFAETEASLFVNLLTVQRILKDNLNMCRIARLLSEEQRENRVNVLK